MKRVLLAVIILFSGYAFGQTTALLPQGGLGVSCNSVTAASSTNPGLAGGCTALALVTSGGALPGNYTWQTIVTGSPASVSVTFVGSLDGVTGWTVLDTNTSTTGTTRTVANANSYRFLGCVPGTLSGGSSPTITCQISVTSTASSGVSVSGAVTAGHIATFASSTQIQDGGAGGTGTVTGVNGTANQITSDGSTTTPTLSLPAAITAPGSLTTTTSLQSTTTTTALTGLAAGANGGSAGVLTLFGSSSGSETLTANSTGSTITANSSLAATGNVSATAGNSSGFNLTSSVGGAAGNLQHIQESITLNTGGTTTDSAANLLPANALILGVTARITTTITTAANWSLGDASAGARFMAANSTLTAGTTAVGLAHWAGTVAIVQSAAAKLRITTNVNPGAGVIHVDVFYINFSAPTS